MIRKFFKNTANKKDKFNKLLDKYNLPKQYFYINRQNVSKGVLIGLFWGFIPMPFQMVAVLATAPFLRFNIIIALAMVWLSNPITMPAMYYMEYLTGSFLLGGESIQTIELSLDWFKENIDDIFIPLYVGAAFYSIIISSIFYYLTNFCWRRSVNKERKIRRKPLLKKH